MKQRSSTDYCLRLSNLSGLRHQTRTQQCNGRIWGRNSSCYFFHTETFKFFVVNYIGRCTADALSTHVMALGYAASGSTASLSPGTPPPFTCAPSSDTMPTENAGGLPMRSRTAHHARHSGVHADSSCTSRSILQSLSCTVSRAAGHQASISTVARQYGKMALFSAI